MRASLDTNVLVSALGWSGPEEGLVQAIIEGRAAGVLHVEVLVELLRVLGRPQFACLGEGVARTFREALVHRVQLVDPPWQVDLVPQDPPDDRVLEAALAGACDLVVSGDRDLLDLQAFLGVPILRAPEALERVDAPAS